MRKHKKYLIISILLLGALCMPEIACASVESSLMSLRGKLTGVIFPLVAACGIVFAGISFFSGNERAKQHIFYAIIGCALGFGAQAIVDFISQTVN